MIKIDLLSWIILLFILPTALKASERLSNGLVEIIIDAEKGSFDILDVRQNKYIIRNSAIGFSLKPYVELWDLGRNEVETALPSEDFENSKANNTISVSSMLKEAFPGGKSISLISNMEGQGELEVQFTLYPGSTFVELGFSFKNLRDKPVRLCKVEVLNGSFMPECNRNELKILTGNSGWKNTEVLDSSFGSSENNILCFFADPTQQFSLVAGGLMYEDFRKFIDIAQDSIRMFAEDPVGKRVDPGTVYLSDDRFYLNGLVDNPFDALEYYAGRMKDASKINLSYYTFPSVCMWFLSVTHFGADATSENSSPGAVKEMENCVSSGFLKYSPVAIRLVPDNYEQNNQQGWWDDEHWQMHGRKERCVVDHHYKEPYETTQKWASRVQEMGGIPLTYFQPGIRSEDYAEAFPGHMLYNESRKYILNNGRIVSDPHPVMGTAGIPDLLNPGKRFPGYGKMMAEVYDYTDPDFLAHWMQVNTNLKNGGVRGVFYDYPDRAFPARGGLEDRYSTAIRAYRNVFRFAWEMMGPNSFLQERLGMGSDATLGFVSSVRTEGDNNILENKAITKAATRWYKNRLLVNYDMDGKALLETGYGDQRYNISPVQRKAILTVSYAVSGRLLLTESFSKFSNEVIYDLSRVFPFHSSTLTARPLDVFINEFPSVFDFGISPEWHQLILYNAEETNKEFLIKLSGNTAFGALGLDPEGNFYLYDFWNDKYVGSYNGETDIVQQLLPGEARVLSIHKVKDNPQWISTNRHIMQGYVDLVKKPEWDSSTKSLSGISSVVAGEPYRITIALNGYTPRMVEAAGAQVEIYIRKDNPGLADLEITLKENGLVSWKVFFK